MAVFLYEIRSTLVRSLGLVKTKEKVKKEDKDHLRQILGLTKEEMQNIYIRNENETQGKDILIVQALMDNNINEKLVEYIKSNVSTKKKWIPDLDVWGIKNYPQEKIAEDGYELLAMDDKLIVKVKPEMVYDDEKKAFEATGRKYMRIYLR